MQMFNFQIVFIYILMFSSQALRQYFTLSNMIIHKVKKNIKHGYVNPAIIMHVDTARRLHCA